MSTFPLLPLLGSFQEAPLLRVWYDFFQMSVPTFMCWLKYLVFKSQKPTKFIHVNKTKLWIQGLSGTTRKGLNTMPKHNGPGWLWQAQQPEFPEPRSRTHLPATQSLSSVQDPVFPAEASDWTSSC